MYSLEQNKITISSLLKQGYGQVYTYTYDHPTILEEMISIQSGCLSNSILCVGAGSVSSEVLLLISCGSCQSILTQTDLNTPRLINGAYWYFTDKKSFGFADSSIISQSSCDTYGPYDNLRLCWHLSNGAGGYRIGQISGLTSDTTYRKLMFVYPITNTTTKRLTTTSTTTTSTTTAPIGFTY